MAFRCISNIYIFFQCFGWTILLALFWSLTQKHWGELCAKYEMISNINSLGDGVVACLPVHESLECNIACIKLSVSLKERQSLVHFWEALDILPINLFQTKKLVRSNRSIAIMRLGWLISMLLTVRLSRKQCSSLNRPPAVPTRCQPAVLSQRRMSCKCSNCSLQPSCSFKDLWKLKSGSFLKVTTWIILTSTSIFKT